MTVEPYQPHLKPEWDLVVEQSRNGTFLHRRDYMDYHADRFEDMSLIARDDSGRIIAVMPAHRCGDTITSHGGLTYGGWLMTTEGRYDCDDRGVEADDCSVGRHGYREADIQACASYLS